MPRISLVELPAQFAHLEGQLARTISLIRPGATDLVVLPEASLTGYVSPTLDFDLTRFAEPLAVGVARLQRLAAALECDVVGPVIEQDGTRCFNTTVGVAPHGPAWLHYRKRHPWYPEEWATPGDTAWPLAEWRGLQVSCAVCFDVHFLEEEAAEVLSRADVLLFPSAWVEKEDSRPERLTALARRFDLTVLNANWGRGTPGVYGQGGSLVARAEGIDQLKRGLVLDAVL
jgi:predicted amidohydrolase